MVTSAVNQLLEVIIAVSGKKALSVDLGILKRLAWLRRDVEIQQDDREAYSRLKDILSTGSVMLIGTKGDGNWLTAASRPLSSRL